MSSAQQKSKIPIGTVLDERYRITAVLGRGGVGEVYQADDVAGGSAVAVKVLSSPEHAQSAERFAREAHILKTLNHPNIVQFYGSGIYQGQFFIAMEFVKGLALSERLLHEGPLDINDVLWVARQSLAALSYAHSFGVVHRDLKPSNIIVCDSLIASHGEHSNESELVKVIDFGMSRLLQHDAAQKLTRTGATVGTVDYMSPEQCLSGHDVDHRADIYALGATLYHCVAGRPPFAKVEDFAVMLAQLQDTPPPLSMLPATQKAKRLEAVIRKAMEKDPGQRYQSAADMLADVEAVSDGREPTFARETETCGPSTFSLPKKPARRDKWRILTYAGIAVLGILLAVTIAHTMSMKAEKDDKQPALSVRQLYGKAEPDIRTLALPSLDTTASSVQRKAEMNLEGLRSLYQANEKDHSLSREQSQNLEIALCRCEFIAIHPQEGWQLFKRSFVNSSRGRSSATVYQDLLRQAMSASIRYMETHPGWQSDRPRHATFDEIRRQAESLWNVAPSTDALLDEGPVWSTFLLAARMDRIMGAGEGELNRLLDAMKRRGRVESVDSGRAWDALGSCFVWNVRKQSEAELCLNLSAQVFSVSPSCSDDWRSLGDDYANLAVQSPLEAKRRWAATAGCLQHLVKRGPGDNAILLFAQYSTGQRNAAMATMHTLQSQITQSMPPQEARAVKQMLERYETSVKRDGDMHAYAGAKAIVDNLRLSKPVMAQPSTAK